MTEQVFQFHVALRDIVPAIWRRFQVRETITFRELHQTLQVMMGWQDSHLYLFEVDAFTVTDQHTLKEWGEPGLPDNQVTLRELLKREGVHFSYQYDFGDSWQHDLTLEAILPPEQGVVYPRCLDGARACPPEDCGGTIGYQEMLRALQDPSHEEHQSYLDWTGGHYDPDRFDLAQVSRQLEEGVYWQGRVVSPPLTSTQRFTTQARWFWDAIPEHVQTSILSSVWCGNCRDTTTLVNFHGNISKGALVLRGECLRCGEPVGRRLEDDP